MHLVNITALDLTEPLLERLQLIKVEALGRARFQQWGERLQLGTLFRPQPAVQTHFQQRVRRRGAVHQEELRIEQHLRVAQAGASLVATVSGAAVGMGLSLPALEGRQVQRLLRERTLEIEALDDDMAVVVDGVDVGGALEVVLLLDQDVVLWTG